MYLDTHVVAWLYAGEVGRFPRLVQTGLNREELLISPIVLLELTLLKKIGRLTVAANTIVETLRDAIDLRICDLPFAAVSQRASAKTGPEIPSIALLRLRRY